ncbi:MAG: UDP-N-acetylenolpyruvoylglucosamine reductase [Candidatus Magasanikbacteria bacterium]|nr:UDP-N-acetylenolpyruvoylglucosamine reductase [Candidatus Magasanikbacteria bacterium]|tara:strand:+ start:2091 stop:3050 length:960 start_codon:yes stop_codon:yes gene_type:complete
MDSFYKQLKAYGKVRTQESLAKHITYKIGGPAKYFITIKDISHLPDVLRLIDGEGINRIILGGGSNILFPDEGYDGVVIKIVDKHFTISGTEVEAVASAQMKEISQGTVSASLAGFVWAIGVPGTIAGALRGNAAYNGIAMEDAVSKVEVYRDGEVVILTQEECMFGPKDSVFKYNTDVILRIWLELKKGDTQEIAQEAMENIAYRKRTQPEGFGSAGCVFKNIVVEEKDKAAFLAKFSDEKIKEILTKYNKIPVGRVVELLGLKGRKSGKAQISTVHGNFIINLGGASAKDIHVLIDLIKENVYNTYGLDLEEEIQIV